MKSHSPKILTDRYCTACVLWQEDIAKLPDVGEGLENRIADAAVRCSTSSEIADLVKTKRYTHARIRRILACALLGIEKAHTQIPIEYVRVLGFTNEGAELLKDCRLNIVTSASNGIRTGGNTKALLEKDILAYDISALAYDIPKGAALILQRLLWKYDIGRLIRQWYAENGSFWGFFLHFLPQKQRILRDFYLLWEVQQ